MSDNFDLIVIGTGAGGSTPAHRCAKEGWRVAVVDELPYGGTCALRGCDPKKVLVGAADLIDWHHRMSGQGIAGEAHIDWPALMTFKRTFTEPVPEDRERAFQRAGVALFHGGARFVDPHRIEVEGRVLEARHFVVAAGAAARALEIPGAEHVINSTAFLELDELPRRIAFVGAGYISLEFAHVARRCGSEVVIFGRGRPLRHFDSDLVDRLLTHTRDVGVELHLNSDVTAVNRRGAEFEVRASAPTGERRVRTDLVVHGAGRVPHTAQLGLEAAEVATATNGGVLVNEFLQSPTNTAVYAAGDAAVAPGSPPLTPVAAYEGGVVASNLVGGNKRTAEYTAIPSVVFTIPPLARVGWTEADAQEQGLEVRVKRKDTRDWYSNRRVAEQCAMFKTVVDAGTDRILGVHVLGPHAEEIINVFALAMRHAVTASQLRHQLYAYPTVSSDVPYML